MPPLKYRSEETEPGTPTDVHTDIETTSPVSAKIYLHSSLEYIFTNFSAGQKGT